METETLSDTEKDFRVAKEQVDLYRTDDPTLYRESCDRAVELYLEVRGNLRNLTEAVLLVEHLLDWISAEVNPTF